MTRNYKTINYTQEDLQGFHFERLTEDAITELCNQRKKSRNTILKVYLIFSLLVFLTMNYHMIIFILGNSLCIFFGIIVIFEIYFCHLVQKKYKEEETQCIHIKIIKKLPKEIVGDHIGINRTTEYFFPVRGEDTTTGYQSICYINKNDYKQKSEGDIVRIVKHTKVKGSKLFYILVFVILYLVLGIVLANS